MSSRARLSVLLSALLPAGLALVPLGCAEDPTTDASVLTRPADGGDCDDIQDVSLTARLNTLYLVDPYVDASRINVETHGCVVTLRGRVQDTGTRDRAAAMARETEGVRSVRNHLEVVLASAAPGRDPS
ncbi:MAG TPA: BON domain-containing protein [Candidatus Polarisedimenticolia bacterium]|nr:BON domain-containing protein [Candidatus Polarisedimenticolia bacterium]